MTKNEFKQQLIISMAGSDFQRLHEDIVSQAADLTDVAEKAGITFDGDTRQGTTAPSIKKGQNAVVINGTVYELVDVPDDTDECGECPLLEKCHNINDVICQLIFGDDVINRHFKKL